MDKVLIDFGRERIQAVADAWGVTVEQAARALEGKEFDEFWKWCGADEFLCMKLYISIPNDKAQLQTK